MRPKRRLSHSISGTSIASIVLSSPSTSPTSIVTSNPIPVVAHLQITADFRHRVFLLWLLLYEFLLRFSSPRPISDHLAISYPSSLTVFRHCSILPSLIMTLASAQFLCSLQLESFRWPETALQRHPSLKQFTVLITPLQQSSILPLPTRHSLALTPIYHHPLIPQRSLSIHTSS